MNAEGSLFGADALDAILAESCQLTAEQRLSSILAAVRGRTHGASPVDDQTLVLAAALS